MACAITQVGASALTLRELDTYHFQ